MAFGHTQSVWDYKRRSKNNDCTCKGCGNDTNHCTCGGKDDWWRSM